MSKFKTKAIIATYVTLIVAQPAEAFYNTALSTMWNVPSHSDLQNTSVKSISTQSPKTISLDTDQGKIQPSLIAIDKSGKLTRMSGFVLTNEPMTVNDFRKEINKEVTNSLDIVDAKMKVNNAAIIKNITQATENARNISKEYADQKSEEIKEIVQQSRNDVYNDIKTIGEEIKSFKEVITESANNVKNNQQQAMKIAKEQAAIGTAISLAASGLTFDTRPAKYSVSFASSYFEGKKAIAAGIGYTTKSGKIRYNAKISTDFNAYGVTVGVGYTF